MEMCVQRSISPSGCVCRGKKDEGLRLADRAIAVFCEKGFVQLDVAHRAQPEYHTMHKEILRFRWRLSIGWSVQAESFQSRDERFLLVL
jgi:hypothetical protein